MAQHRDASRRTFLAAGSTALAASLLDRVEAAARYDLLICGGTLLDGTGGPAYTADVAITGDVISAVGAMAPEQARRVLDVSGLHVCPGFVDIHTHSDGTATTSSARGRPRQCSMPWPARRMTVCSWT